MISQKDKLALRLLRALQPFFIGLAVILSGCDAGAQDVCYSKFSSSEYREFKHALSPQLSRLFLVLGDAYLNDPEVIDLPVISEGNVYLASTCAYALRVERKLNGSIKRKEILQKEYAHYVELAGKSGRVIKMERN